MIAGPSGVVTKTGTVSSTALTLGEAGFDFEDPDVANADRMLISVSAGALRVTWDNPIADPPTTSAGLKIVTNNWPLFELIGRSRIQNFQMIRDGSTDATVAITLESGL